MTRKHFEAIASALRNAKPSAASDDMDHECIERNFGAAQQWHQDVKAMADTLGRFNGQFDRERFNRACGLD